MSSVYDGGSNTAVFLSLRYACSCITISTLQTGADMASPFTVYGRLWIEGQDGTVLGHGRVELLEKIDDLGSLSAAASALGMSYRYAWKQVKSINTHSDSPLIKLSAGGRGGGYACLTESGKKAVATYRQANQAFEQFLSRQSEKLPG